VVSFTVTLPYSEADFDAAKRDKFKTAVAATAGTRAENVEIVSVIEKRRRAGSLDVTTKILAADQQGMEAAASALGTGETLKTNLNKNLAEQGLKAASDVSTPVTGDVAAESGGCRTSSWAWARALLLAGLACVCL